MTTARWIGNLGLLVLLSGCGSLGGGTSEAPRTTGDVERLRQRVLDLERQSRVYEVENARLKQQLDEANAQLAEIRRGDPPAPTAPAPVPESSQASAETPPPQAPASISGKEIEESDIEDEEMLPSPSEVALPAADALPVTELDPVDSSAQALYDSAYTFFHQEDYGAAERAFQSFLDRYPTTDLSDNALFWVGESRYAEGRYEEALRAFYETVERYPTGNKVADAMLKAGKCLEGLNNPAQARQTYQEVVERFPNSIAALTAQDRLQQLP